jgi:hypothetical protein
MHLSGLKVGNTVATHVQIFPLMWKGAAPMLRGRDLKLSMKKIPIVEEKGPTWQTLRLRIPLHYIQIQSPVFHPLQCWLHPRKEVLCKLRSNWWVDRLAVVPHLFLIANSPYVSYPYSIPGRGSTKPSLARFLALCRIFKKRCTVRTS